LKTAVEKIVGEIAGRFPAAVGGGSLRRKPRFSADEQPLRAELFSVDQLERHAKALAGWHELMTRRGADRLLPRLMENESVLLHTYDLVTKAAEAGRRIAPAGEWLLDNFYLIEEQIRTARRHLPKAYSRELPALANGPAAGYPRVYGIALELISHVDGRLDAASLRGFIASYQSIQPLRLGELWAVPIMLRLALLENLRRVAARIAAGRMDRNLANEWADKMVQMVERNPTDLIIVLADMARADVPFTSAFVTELTRHLHGQSPYFGFATSWMEHRLQDQGLTIEQLVQAENQNQAADQVSIGNSITSLRFLSAMDWKDFVEEMSVVEQILRGEPAGIYPHMDFATRDRYRHSVEEIAKRSRVSEFDVARKAIKLCEMSADTVPGRSGHVGYYLIDKGRPTLERLAEMRFTPRLVASKLLHRLPLPIYLGGVLLITLAVTLVFVACLHHAGLGALGLTLLGFVALWPATHLGVGLVNWLATLTVTPRALARMDYSGGLPPEHAGVVAIPTILSSAAGNETLLEGLEVRYLANRDVNLRFALLTDFRDAEQETTAVDAELVSKAAEGIEALNDKYAADRNDVFYLFHRPRLWNAEESRWMGYERKRGKLADFNAVLRDRAAPASGNGETSRNQPRDRFSKIVGDTRALLGVKYVITLDTDTQLPRNAARELIGTLAHPLNRPVVDPLLGRVVSGYGILQPRVGVSLPSASKSWFVKLFAGEPGIDPYTRAVSDVYQDVFCEGSFIGKGIYDVDAFEQTCSNFPENTVLSHDLLESCYARSALVSDVELYEEHPSRYTADVSRRHRWVRGDWQIAPWIAPAVWARDGQRVRNTLSALSRWKIFDNLRRSLVPIAEFVVLIAGWLLAMASARYVVPRHFSIAAVTTIFTLAAIALPALLSVALSLLKKPEDLAVNLHLRNMSSSLSREIGQLLLSVVFLPYEAFKSADAIVRTLSRMFWTHRRLLEWTTSIEAERAARMDLPGFFVNMAIAPALGICLAALTILLRPGELPLVGTFAVLWTISPFVAWWISRTIPPRRVQFTAEQTDFLRKLARRTWRYFEQYVTAEERWLPPDNFQERPTPVIASRTSPTNIGLALLANISAYDFGYISAARTIRRVADTVDTLEAMERHRGHLYNWYETRTLRPLPPLYVSTVDSGNLAGHLFVLRRGLFELIDAPILPARMFEGIRDTLHVAQEIANGKTRAADGTERTGPLAPPDILRKLEQIDRDLNHPPRRIGAAHLSLQRLVRAAGELNALLTPRHDAELLWWAAALERCCRDQLDDLLFLAPWSALPAPEPAWRQSAGSPLHAQADAMRDLLAALEEPPTLKELARLEQTLAPSLDSILQSVSSSEDGSSRRAAEFLCALRSTVTEAAERAAGRIKVIDADAQRVLELANMDFAFLLDKQSDLFAIGYNVSDHRLDASFYDLLASEARLASFVAIAQGQVSQDHWFALGRMLTRSRGAPALLSWSGSMFEYLMPMLVMPSYEGTLLDQTCRSVVRRQIDYGRQRGVPWGISESAYNTTDAAMNYQYRAFGVPGLGLKRGLAEDLVIAPYATVMALMVAPREALKNLRRLDAEGKMGALGFYEAIDHTPSRLPPGQTEVTIPSFMSHHEGMSLLALAYVLLNRPMQRRFESEELFKATDLLLQERIPRAAAPVFPHATEAGARQSAGAGTEGTMRVFTDPSSLVPEVHLISNGRYHVMISSAGGGYSRWRDLAITRWREDVTRDCWGTFLYIRDVDLNRVWSSSHQPTLAPSRQYEAIFTQARAEFRRRDAAIDSHTEIAVSPEDDIELRRLTLTNRGIDERTLEITSYAEVVLAPAAQDMAHPAFSNLFVQTNIVPARQAIFCTRRPRSMGERPPHMLHLMTVQGNTLGEASFETDRSKFIGRGRTAANPIALSRSGPLSNSEGSVLDPIVSIRRTITLAPDESVRIDIITGAAETREAATALLEKYHDPRLADRVFELAWTHAHVVLQHLNAAEADAQLYGRLAGSVVYSTALRRANASIIARNRRGQSGLWGYGISGDLPIVLVRVRDQEGLNLVRQAVQAHAYWRNKGLAVDLVIWNEDHSVYRQDLQETITSLLAASPEAALLDKPGGVFVRRGEQLSDEDRILLQAVARVILLEEAGTLAEQIEKRGRGDSVLPALRIARRKPETLTAVEAPRRDLAYYNGYGGFTRDGREYVTILKPDATTPLPWANVIANANFGTVVTESGSVYTWAENSHEFRITPWYNDPVSDTSGEALYLRDEESGRFWSPTPLPARGPMPYVSRHGFGYSIFEYEEDGIASALTIYVAIDASVKFVHLKVVNRSGRTRRLSFTGFWELVLGELGNKTMMHVVTELDPKTGALFARNAYSQEFADRVVFVDTADASRSVTGDRTEFIGRNGSLADPAAMHRARLSNRVGAALDPAAAMQVIFELEDEQDREVIFTMGAARGADQARGLAQRFRGATNARAALEAVWNYWNRTLGVVYVQTPDESVNFLANGWLLYQTLACRMWARTGFYQSGGAYGFRDQLQDSMALLHAEPKLLREQLLRAAGRQFKEGDVQHWWHPPVGRGVRTHFSDDYLWLPYVACRYVLGTGDTGVLDERIAFIEGRPLRPEEESYYDQPQVSEDIGSLYDHCCRAIKNGLRFGVHNLPLMGCGDWNDGMNLVGEHGKGESVWLAFFLYDVLKQFGQVAHRRNDAAFADMCENEASRLQTAIEAEAWDGNWYRRAYFDNGEPLGSASNPECQIDSLPQSWAILSGAGDPQRSRDAMEQVDHRLVRRATGLIQLFDPPFDHSDLNPGYIRGYVPGVRENGGQYTHAAVWTVMAFAAMNDPKRAWELFDLINPVAHSSSAKGIAVYKAEPYVVAADVYAVAPHTGRGGWTWYTGSAGWMYRLITESLLGLRLEIDRLIFTPCVPPEWKTYKVHYRYRETFYHVTINNPGGFSQVVRVTLDGTLLNGTAIPMVDDRKQHNVEIELGTPQNPAPPAQLQMAQTAQ
jgi:cyclic beta-1,2-glucan synthetase